MLVIFEWYGPEAPKVTCELPAVPRHEESVSLTFPGQPEHVYRVHWVRWYPQADPPYVSVRLATR